MINYYLNAHTLVLYTTKCPNKAYEAIHIVYMQYKSDDTSVHKSFPIITMCVFKGNSNSCAGSADDKNSVFLVVLLLLLAPAS